jgi:invasion protein IalB
MMSVPCVKQSLSPLVSAVTVLSIMLLNPAVAQQASPPGSAAKKAGEPEMASRSQRSLVRQIKYGDWQKFCFKTPGTNMVCRTTISGTWDTGQTAVRADLIEREGDSKARLQLFLPVGMYLQAGIKLTVDQGKPHQIPYVWCMTNACIAGNAADPQLIREMEEGEKLVLEVVDSSVQSVSTTLPLNQFASVRKGAPAQTFQQDVDE